MKKIINTNKSEYSFDAAILALRLVVGFAMLSHGLPKMETLFSGEVKFPAVMGLNPELSLGITVFAEVFCSILIIFGLGTRLAVIPLISVMGVAAFYVHAADGFSKQEPAVLYLTFYLLLFLVGSARFSLDYLLQRKLERLYG